MVSGMVQFGCGVTRFRPVFYEVIGLGGSGRGTQINVFNIWVQAWQINFGSTPLLHRNPKYWLITNCYGWKAFTTGWLVRRHGKRGVALRGVKAITTQSSKNARTLDEAQIRLVEKLKARLGCQIEGSHLKLGPALKSGPDREMIPSYRYAATADLR